MEYYIKRDEIRRFIREAQSDMAKYDIPEEERSRLFDRYEEDLKKYMFTFNEWYAQYDISEAATEKKETFISRSRAQKYYRSIITPERRALFFDKRKFLTHFKPFIKHDFFEISASTPQSVVLQKIIDLKEVIVKPISGSLGWVFLKLWPKISLTA